MGVTVWPGSLVALPNMADIGNVVLAYDFKAILANIPSALVMIFVLFVGDFFATFSALTAVSVQTGWIDEDLEKAVLPLIPMGRLIQPEDIAETILFLASTQARMLTGQVIKVSGGKAL